MMPLHLNMILICLHLNLLFNLEWCLPNHFMDNQGLCMQTQIWHLLNMVLLNPVLCHPNNTVNLELSTRICKDNNMELPDLCLKANLVIPQCKTNLVIPQCKINMNNNHHNIDFVEKRKSNDKIYCDNVRNIVFNNQKAKHIIINKLT